MQAISPEFLKSENVRDRDAASIADQVETLLSVGYSSIQPRGAAQSLRNTLSALPCLAIPPTVGGYIPSSRNYTPKGFKSLERLTVHAIYPYTFNGTLVNIKAQATQDVAAWRPPVSCCAYEAGIFMESNVGLDTTEAIAGTSELGACVIYGKCTLHTFKIPPVICLGGLPLPENYQSLKRLTIVAFDEAPLTLDYAFRLYGALPVAQERQLDIRVLDLHTSVSNLPASLYIDIQNQIYKDCSLYEWIVDAMGRREILPVSVAADRFKRYEIPFAPVRLPGRRPRVGRKPLKVFLNRLHALEGDGYYGKHLIQTTFHNADILKPNGTYNSPPNEVFHVDDTVLISKELVEYIRLTSIKQRRNIFLNINELDTNLRKNNLIIPVHPAYNVPAGKFWVMTRDNWDRHVKQTPLALPVPVENANLQLEKLA